MKVVIAILLIIFINVVILCCFTDDHLDIYKNLIGKALNVSPTELKFMFLNNTRINLRYNLIAIILVSLLKLITILSLPILSVVFLIAFITLNNTDYFFFKCISKFPSNRRDRIKYISENTKYGWFKLFKDLNIPTPEVMAVHNGGELTILNDSFDKNKKYLIKPNHGQRGKGITYDSYANYMGTHAPSNDTMLFQERIYDCRDRDVPRYIRYITVLNKRSNQVNTLVYSIHTGKRNEVVTNRLIGADFFNCDNTNCKQFNKLEQGHLKTISDKLKKLHQTHFNDIENMGWDVIIACDSAYVLEGNLCHGTPLTPYFQQKYKMLTR